MGMVIDMFWFGYVLIFCVGVGMGIKSYGFSFGQAVLIVSMCFAL